MHNMSPVFVSDVEYISERVTQLIQSLQKAHILITGGTGFFGKWLLQTFSYLNEEYELRLTVYVLSRDPQHFLKEYPFFNKMGCLRFIQGDVNNERDMVSLSKYNFTHIIHAATATAINLYRSDSVSMFNTIVHGTRLILDLAKKIPTQPAILYISSGAIYGVHSEVELLSEDLDQLLPTVNSVYALGKRAAENLCHLYTTQYHLNIKIARCFSFVGPYLPLDTHFAIGNFIRDALNGGPIVINGTGHSVYRSYQYAADLIVWLLTILIEGKMGAAYNVGSDEVCSILKIAEWVANNYQPALQIDIKGDRREQGVQSYYAPNVSRAMQDFSLPPNISLSQAIQKTLSWHRDLS